VNSDRIELVTAKSPRGTHKLLPPRGNMQHPLEARQQHPQQQQQQPAGKASKIH